jgi:hypothetical protein
MSRFIEIRYNLVINVDHIVDARMVRWDAEYQFTVYLTNGHEIAIDDKDVPQFIEKLLTNQPDQSTIKVNQDSNQPEKGKKYDL